MAWFQVDDQLSFHPKVIQAGNAAMGMWVRAGAWSQAHLTEGHIPTEQAKALGGVALAKKLVAAGLWIADDERGGYLFHEWDSRQMSADEIAERRAMRARAGAKGGKASAQSRRAKAEAKRQASASPGGDVSEMESCNDFGENESKTQTRNADRVTTQESRRKPRPPGDMSKSSQASAEASGSANVKQNPTPAPVPTQEASNEASNSLSPSSETSPARGEIETEREHPASSMILIPDDWAPNDLHAAKHRRNDLEELAETFRDHALSSGRRCHGRGGWDAAFSNWVRKSPSAPGVGSATTKANGWLDIANAAADDPTSDQKAIGE